MVGTLGKGGNSNFGNSGRGGNSGLGRVGISGSSGLGSVGISGSGGSSGLGSVGISGKGNSKRWRPAAWHMELLKMMRTTERLMTKKLAFEAMMAS